MGDTSFEHTLTKLKIAAYTDEELIEFGKTDLMQKRNL